MIEESLKNRIIRYLLTPLSVIYGAVMWIRNKLFDVGIFKEQVFDVPVVGVGNITIGGTGKTPHVEYIVKMLGSDYNIVVLSRGYKRKTRGFLIANRLSTPTSIGDEPMQIYRKYGSFCKVVVCENRKEGIRKIMSTFPDTTLILLDDSFQHRWVKPKVSILLVDYNRPINHDKLLPLGRLRESCSQIYRADKIIVTKCPDAISPIDYRIKTKEQNLFPFQDLFFSKFVYGEIRPVFADDAPYHVSLSNLGEKDSVMLLTGIANPRSFIKYFTKYQMHLEVNHYPDHHDFTKSDLNNILNRFDDMGGRHKIIVTTEKDAVRLLYNPYFPQELKPYLFYIPVEVKMLPGLDNEDFVESLRKSVNKVDPSM